MKFINFNLNELGLKVLTQIKNIKGESVDFSAFNQVETSPVDHQFWSRLLGQHVAENGQVDYQGFIKNKSDLEQYLTLLSNYPPGKNWNNSEKLAYWINAYNAFTIKLIIDHYPLKSIKDISDGLPMINSPWDIKFFKIGNIDFDLNTIEHEILRKQFDEPRIHFAINCASFSCPKLRQEAFVADRLEEQLEDQAKSFIQNSDKNKISNSSTQLSKIFSWFENDFTRRGSLADYVKKYKPDLKEENQLEYLEYNWALNE